MTVFGRLRHGMTAGAPAVRAVARSVVKVEGFNFHAHEKGIAGGSFQTAAVNQTKNDGGPWFAVAHNTESGHGQNPVNGVKQPGHSGRGWFADLDVMGHLSSNSNARKAASAQIAKIPFELAAHVARILRPGFRDLRTKAEDR